MKRPPRILFLCMMIFILTACQPMASDPSGTPEESSVQREETSATDPQEESSVMEKTDMTETSGEEETSSEETRPVEEPTGYVEGEIQAELICIKGVLYVYDEREPQDGTLPRKANLIGKIKSVVTTEEPKRDFEGLHVELGTEIYWTIEQIDYYYVKRPGSNRYERFVRIFEKDKWWTEEPMEVIEYEVEPVGDTYYMYDTQLTKEGDHYILTGEQRHVDELRLTWYQKEKLDAGAVLNVFYEGEHILKVTSGVRTTGGLDFVYKIVKYSENEIVYSENGLGANPTTSAPWVEEPPFSGIAYVISGENGGYRIPLQGDFEITLSGDMPVETLNNGTQRGETITLGEFYETRILPEGGKHSYQFEIYTEEGEVIKVKEVYVP